ncbi:DNA repair protein RecN (Recombination protein N) [Flagellimonas taeanensis]|uniref:DNA repair protein RecN n=1 Tax=Flagellimonas taeanensis TaxID=1005926 RepID=A0A1M7BWU6_9FLAO|nr:DNA repair protein RecN [Allomuricauda taeanensis]SFC50543.1 DNA repair protein RecN (Recombination protein N) [Allomuricauda taeanensis]SHL59495.1 DNA replication and repair protein RecN [Allomuricauda taeanensis]
MLTNLSIQNYALIDDVNVAFPKGFTTITGETGAGKSILLGGLSLVLGKRADLTSLKNEEQKCVIEAEFDLSKYQLQQFFKENDLDYEDVTILRREILPSGKSRAFVNDTPVTLDVLRALGDQLVDVHSQHQTMRLTENDFQMKVVDALAGNADNLKEYGAHLQLLKKAAKELKELETFQSNADKEHEYNSFLLKELEDAKLKEGMQEELETEYEQLSNVEQIMEQLSTGHQLLNDEQLGILGRLADLRRAFQALTEFGPAYKSLGERIESVLIETDDIASEIEQLKDTVEADPARLEVVNGQLQLLYDLQKKHHVATVAELIAIRDELAQKVEAVANIESKIAEKRGEVDRITQQVEAWAQNIHKARKGIVPKLKQVLQENLASLGMPSATFKIEINPSNTYKFNGKDDLEFLFSANKGSSYGELKKVASGGELSRIMLTIKSILATYEHLPTLMFDEIDTGVSGEISNRMGEIMQQMSQNMQVFSITHLPQVASKGQYQFKVYKEESEQGTSTHIKQLSVEERVRELAEMLGGKSISESALAHARELLQ